MDHPEPLVSVCIANYNGMSVIDDCIRSVCAQSGSVSVEILVHDDASLDDSVEHIRNHYPNVKLLESAENVGFCIANNRMALAAKGRYLLLLNNDAELYLDAVSTLIREAQRIPKPAILSLPQYNAKTGTLLDIGARLDPFLNHIPILKATPNDVGMVAGACLWIDKTLWDELDGFPAFFESLAEDLFLCCRARLRGYPVRALGVSGYRHHVGTSFGGGKTNGRKLSTTFRRRALTERNKTFVIAMCYPAPLMQVVLPIHLAILLLEGFVLSLLRCDRTYLQQIYLPIIPALFRQRKELCNIRYGIFSGQPEKAIGFFTVFNFFPQKLQMLLRHGLPKVR
jgi:GT2 family glycosyltransferase